MANRIKLTKATIDSLDHSKDGQWVTDTEVPQLVVRITPTSKSFVARWTSKTTGKRIQTTVDSVNAISVSEARTRVRKLVAEDRPHSVDSLSDIFEIWNASYASEVSAGHAEEFRRTWHNHIGPDLGRVKLSRLKHADLQKWYRKKREEHPLSAKGKPRATPYSAAAVKRWMSYISKLCAIARKHGHMIGNPTEGLEMATPERRLDVFTKSDISDLAENLTALADRYPIGVALIRFMMIFPCRGAEAREMQWSDLDLDEGTWTIPASRYKTNKDQVFPLGPIQVEHLRGLPRWSKHYVFPRPSDAGVGATKTTERKADRPVTKNHQNLVWKKVRPKPLGAHTLRKTIGYALINGGAPLEAVSKLLGHSNTLVTQEIYARLDPKNAGKYLDIWHAALASDAAKDTNPPKPHDDHMLEFEARRSIDQYNANLSERMG